MILALVQPSLPNESHVKTMMQDTNYNQFACAELLIVHDQSVEKENARFSTNVVWEKVHVNVILVPQ